MGREMCREFVHCYLYRMRVESSDVASEYTNELLSAPSMICELTLCFLFERLGFPFLLRNRIVNLQNTFLEVHSIHGICR